MGFTDYLWRDEETRELRESYEPDSEHVAPEDHDINVTLLAFITTILSSSVLASFIKYWLLSRRRKITISVGNRKIEYEGPDIKPDEAMIQTMIEQLLKEEERQELSINYKCLPEEDTVGECKIAAHFARKYPEHHA